MVKGEFKRIDLQQQAVVFRHGWPSHWMSVLVESWSNISHLMNKGYILTDGHIFDAETIGKAVVVFRAMHPYPQRDPDEFIHGFCSVEVWTCWRHTSRPR